MKRKEKKSKTSIHTSSIHGDSGRKSSRGGAQSSHLVNPVQVKLENELQQWCADVRISSVPSVLVLDKHTSKMSARSEGTKNAIVVRRSFNTVEKKDYIKSVEMQSFAVGTPMLKVIHKMTLAYSTVTKLKLSDCGLTDEGICVIATFLSRTKTVEDLNIDQNPVREQNYACLLNNNTTLKHLSLRLCEIDSYGTAFLAQVLEFQEPANQHLLTLNLNSNHINCLAVTHLANALRTNRDLLMLSLADNQIEDVGVTTLVEVFQQFELIEEEILIRRKRNLARLLQHLEELVVPVSSTPTHSSHTAETTSQSTDKQSVTTEGKSRRATVKSGKSKSKRSSRQSSGAKMSIKSKGEHNEFPSSLTGTSSLPCDDSYPFLQESFPQDNLITEEGMKQLLSTLKYQKDFKSPHHGTGIIWLNTKGNLFEEVHEHVGSIEEILEQKISYLSLNQNSVNTETSTV